jgi:hypothetical protein
MLLLTKANIKSVLLCLRSLHLKLLFFISLLKRDRVKANILKVCLRDVPF